MGTGRTAEAQHQTNIDWCYLLGADTHNASSHKSLTFLIYVYCQFIESNGVESRPIRQ